MPLQLVSWRFKNRNKYQNQKIEMQLNHNFFYISIPKDSKEATMGPSTRSIQTWFDGTGIAQNANLAKSATSVNGLTSKIINNSNSELLSHLELFSQHGREIPIERKLARIPAEKVAVRNRFLHLDEVSKRKEKSRCNLASTLLSKRGPFMSQQPSRELLSFVSLRRDLAKLRDSSNQNRR